MKRLNELYDCKYDVLIKDIKINSKQVEKGDLFVCIKGVNCDRHDFIDEAIENGASALIVGHDIDRDIPYIKVEDPNKEFPIVTRKFYDYPDEKLKIIGVTGTDGKTTTATIIQTLIGNDKCAYMGTNGVRYKNVKKELSNTTPDADVLYKYFSEFVNAGCKYVVMEASSEAFFRNRLSNIKFCASILTNITSDHLNIHKTMENYIACKCKLFKQTINSGVCVLNYDDKYYETVEKNCNGNIYTYGKNNKCDMYIEDYKIYIDKTVINIRYDNQEYKIISPLLGEFNVYNLSAGILLCLKLGISYDEIIKNIKKIKVEGRVNVIDSNDGYKVIIDYAHTPNALKELLNFVNKVKINKVITVTGSAGGRDKMKRPLMGEVVCDLSDTVVFTADDPRNEDILDIIHDLISTTKKNNYIIEPDRKKAINKALSLAHSGDIVVIAGRGNDTNMPYKDGYIVCNDFDEVNKYINSTLINNK